MIKKLKKSLKISHKEKARFCSIRETPFKPLDAGINPGRAALIRENRSKWVSGTNLRYYFFKDKKTDGQYVKYSNGKKVWVTWVGAEGQMKVVRKAFKMWKDIGIDLSFTEVDNRADAEIRIGFMQDDGSWSYIGRDILAQGVNERTMNFGWDIDVSDRHNGIDTAIHEIGHTLGFPHEHQNPFSGIVWDEQVVYAALAEPPNEWTEEETYENIIKKIGTNEVRGSNWDANSIMHYSFEPGLILKPLKYNKNGLYPAGGLSPSDIKWAKSFYFGKPKSKTIAIEPMVSQELSAGNGMQQDFDFTPTETRYYNIQIFGKVDTVMVLFENLKNGKLQYLSADDNSGTDNIAALKLKLFRDKTYTIKVRVYYKNKNEKATVMAW